MLFRYLFLFLIVCGLVFAYTAPSNNYISIVLDSNYTAPNNQQIEIRLWDANATYTPPSVEPVYEWYCNGQKITETDTRLFTNLPSGSTAYINCTLSVSNVHQEYVNWNKTTDNANWSFSYQFNITGAP